MKCPLIGDLPRTNARHQDTGESKDKEGVVQLLLALRLDFKLIQRHGMGILGRWKK